MTPLTKKSCWPCPCLFVYVGEWAVWHLPHQLWSGVKAASLNAYYVTPGAQ